MSIYRGEGGAGDATNDVSVNQITAYSLAAQTAATQAAASATSASTNATNATSSASAAATSATNAASSASSAATSASTATTQASNAGASATAATSSATTAASSASGASSSASSASASASAAATSASNASTSATTASTQASNASSSASSASTSASNAATSASTASTQASNASTSASNASTSASNAASSATAAAGSATAAATSAASINDANIVHKTGDETVAGIKSFSNNLNVGQTTSALQSGGTGATLYGPTSSEIKFLNSTTGQDATDGTALVATGNVFTINNRETSGTLVLGTNNTERVRVDSVGNVGIGTSTGVSYRLEVASGDTTASFGYALRLRSNATAAAATLQFTDAAVTNQNGYISVTDASVMSFSGKAFIDASGNVNIGSTGNYGGLLSVNRAQSASVADLLTLRDASAGTTFNLQTYGDPVTGTANRFNYNGAYVAFRRGGTEQARFDANNNFLVGTINSEGPSKVSVVQTITNQACVGMRHTLGNSESFARFINAGNTAVIGSITNVGNTATAYTTSSDYRLKDDITPMIGALEKVVALKPCTYKWKSDRSEGQGFIAHELAEVEPSCVIGEKDAIDGEGKPKYQGIDTSFLIATLTAAIQEQQALIESLTARLTALEIK